MELAKEFLLSKEILRSDLIDELAKLLNEFAVIHNQELVEENKLLNEMLVESALHIYEDMKQSKRTQMEKYFRKRGFVIGDCDKCKRGGCNECHYTGFQINKL